MSLFQRICGSICPRIAMTVWYPSIADVRARETGRWERTQDARLVEIEMAGNFFSIYRRAISCLAGRFGFVDRIGPNAKPRSFLVIRAFNLSPTARKALEASSVIVAIALAVFLGFRIAYFCDDFLPRVNNTERLRNARILRDAVEIYRREFGHYPVLPEGPYDRLAPALIGQFSRLPNDPLFYFTGKTHQFRYVSDGSYYGFLINLDSVRESNRTIPGGYCLVGRNTAGTGIWGEPPPCPLK
jgi:hypothetical protein